jgi:heavy metal sensor kinase
MIAPRSLRVRLAVSYFASVALISALAATGYWFAIRTQLDYALDQGLRYRLIGMRQFLDTAAAGGPEAVAARLREVVALGDLFLVFDARGTLVAQSDGLARHGVRQPPPPGLGHEILFTSGGPADFRVRLAWQRVSAGGVPLVLGVADPQRKFEGVLGSFTVVLLTSMLAILGVATLGGIWLGRRALAPVARITDDARAIGERSLSARLAVPQSGDELQQLSETLNAMLGRIDESFTRTRQFTADASHELRAPMTLISTAAQFALRRERTRDELLDSLRKILRESQHTTALIDDLLQLARGDAGREDAPLTPLDLAPLVREAADQAQAIGAARQIAVDWHLDRDTCPVRGDGMQLRRLLLILVDNALKYTPAGGRVSLHAKTGDSDVSIGVADTGPGIAAADLPHVFERFWRADKVRSRESGGTGLGLAIAKQIADRHRGRIDVQSEVGRGTVFTVHLPR